MSTNSKCFTHHCDTMCIHYMSQLTCITTNLLPTKTAQLYLPTNNIINWEMFVSEKIATFGWISMACREVFEIAIWSLLDFIIRYRDLNRQVLDLWSMDLQMIAKLIKVYIKWLATLYILFLTGLFERILRSLLFKFKLYLF